MKKSFAQSQAALIAAHLEDRFDTLSADDEDSIAQIISALEVTGAVHIIITDAAGTVIYDPAGLSDKDNFPMHYFETSLAGNDVFFSGFYAGIFSSSAFTPITNQAAVIGAVCFNEEDINQGSLLLGMQSTILNISIIVAVFSVVIIALIVISVMSRVNSIISAVKSVREGEYSYTIGMSGSDELALLSDEFNSLTERLRMTEEVRRRFVADASHELKTPLATIRLLTDSILQNPDIGLETLLEFIGDINMESERLARTTDKLITLTRLDSQIDEEPARVNIKDTVNDTIRMLTSLAENKNVAISKELSDNCYIKATEDSMHHIVFNLIENAIKYNHPGGSVNIRLELIDDKVVLAVEDRGKGIPKKDLPHIFDRFYRVDKARSHDTAAAGSGLGLAIVRDTVRDLGGTVTAQKRKGGGMVFTVEFAYYKQEET